MTKEPRSEVSRSTEIITSVPRVMKQRNKTRPSSSLQAPHTFYHQVLLYLNVLQSMVGLSEVLVCQHLSVAGVDDADSGEVRSHCFNLRADLLDWYLLGMEFCLI